jgi:hypothetical protein
MDLLVLVLAQADRTPLHVVEQRLKEGFHGFHDLNRILPGAWILGLV